MNNQQPTQPMEERFKKFIEDYKISFTKRFPNQDDNELVMHFIAQEKSISYAQGRVDMAGEMIEAVNKGIEDYKVSKEAKFNTIGADYIFVYDLKIFVLKPLLAFQKEEGKE